MKFCKSFVILTLVIFSLSVMPRLSADEPAKANDQWIMLPVMKLSRGIANVAFGPLELPMKWYDVNAEMGGIAGITYGTLKGVAYVIAREVVGVVDIITFPFPLPDCPEYPDDAGWGYGPIIRPAWVVPVGSDWNSFVYDDESIVNPNL